MHGVMSAIVAAAVAVVAMIGAAVAAKAAQPPRSVQAPPGSSFIARDAAQTWRLHRVARDGAIHAVPTEHEPRHACFDSEGRSAVYSASDGAVRRVAPGASGGFEESVLASPGGRQTYTQACSSAGMIYAVAAVDGKSQETDIVRIVEGAAPQAIARQPGAQQEPHVHAGRWLVYASASCTDGCDRMLVEIWSRDLAAGIARQVTLLNAFSQAPVSDGRWIVFSSNAEDGFQLWRVGFDGRGLERLTRERGAQALQPTLCAGALYYLRSTPSGSGVVKLESGRAVPVALAGVEDVRGLRCTDSATADQGSKQGGAR